MPHRGDHRRKQQHLMSTQSPKSGTAPDYSVEEDQYGRLINREKRMIWPDRKPRKRSEFERIISMPPLEVPIISPARSTATDIYLNSAHIANNQAEDRPDPEVEQAFIGGSTPKEAAAKVDPSAFVLYYRIEEPLSDKAYLYMAYKNNQGQPFHFPLTCRKAKHDDGSETTYWRVEYGDPEAKEFPCLSALVRYHQVFSYYDLKTGAIEAFPLWSGDQVIVDRD
ncbi:unnamed protein product [Cylicocyclus nassatus]|uniref:Uncharacterized protein n=1 Tax=Cylicocyclus nassatus TaxID=53992 RepID=A0AA36H6U4_CYLNA|nr:unnamed protein product [Cylicocyclus nassatus]